MATSGGGQGLRDANALHASVEQPQMTFDGVDLYPNLARKATALRHSLIANHPFVDGNNRIGHAAMEVMLVLNCFKLSATVDEQESVVLAVARGAMTRDDFGTWVEGHVTPLTGGAT